MSDSAARSQSWKWPAAWGLALVLAVGLRLVWIGSDPTVRLSWSNGIFTDPPVMVHAARNAALFGQWILDYNRDLWVFPLMNGLTRLAYAIAEPGRIPTVVLSGLAGVITVAATAWGLGRSLGQRAALLGALFGATSYYMVMFSRVPIAENVVVALLTTAAALAMGRSRVELAAAGALAVGATLFGKYHAIGALPGLVLFVALRPGRWRSVGVMVAGGTVVFIAWLIAIYVPHREEILSHVARQSTGIHGALPFAVSLGDGFGEFFNTVRRSWMFYRMPVLGTVGGLFLLWTVANGAARKARLLDGSAVYAFWFLSLWLYFVVLPYKAPRYFVLLAPTFVAGTAAAVELLLRRQDFRFVPPVRWDEHVPLAVWVYSFLFTGVDAVKHFASMWLEYSTAPPAKISNEMYQFTVRVFQNVDTLNQGLFFAAVTGIVTYVALLWNPEILARFGRPEAGLGHVGLRRLAGSVTILAIGFGLFQWSWWASHRTTFIEDGKTFLPAMVRSDAAVLGPLAPLMTQNSRLRCYPYFGPPGEPGILEKYGITHVMVSGKGDRQLIETRFPGLLDSTHVVHRWPIRTLFAGTMELRRLPRSYGGVPLHEYQPTEFELGVTALEAEQPQEALEHFSRHREALGGDFPELVSLESVCWYKLEDYDEAEKQIREAIRRRPGDPMNLRKLCLLQLKQGDRGAAMQTLYDALRLDPKDEELRSMLTELNR